jgi:Helix-hairpin-helix domain/Rad51
MEELPENDACCQEEGIGYPTHLPLEMLQVRPLFCILLFLWSLSSRSSAKWISRFPDYFELHLFQELGVGAAEIKKLKDGHIHTVDALAHASKKELAQIKGLSEAKVVKLKEAGELMFCASEDKRYFRNQPLLSSVFRRTKLGSRFAALKLIPSGFLSATIVLQQRQTCIKFTTGCAEFDKILDGGL